METDWLWTEKCWGSESFTKPGEWVVYEHTEAGMGRLAKSHMRANTSTSVERTTDS